MEAKPKTNLFIPGVGKSGTSSLHSYLNQHPLVNMSTMKEPQFFCMEDRFKQGMEYYNSLFEDKKGTKYYGESSTSYIGSEIAITRIKEYVENPKFIVLLRNPIDRIYSHYTWLVSLGKEKLPFKQAVLEDMDTVFDPNKPIDGMGFKSYYFFSRYGFLIERYFNAFGRENICIITTETLKKTPLETMNFCFRFLNITEMKAVAEENENITSLKRTDKTPVLLKKISNRVPAKIKVGLALNKLSEMIFVSTEAFPPISVENREWLKGLLHDEIEKLKKITGTTFAEWHDFA